MMSKSLNIDIIFPWEIGLIIVVIGIIFILLGLRQSKKKIDDFDNIPFIKSTTKIFFGSVLCIFGLIQLLPLIKQI
jgi:hypothetical protein|tara:strand:+ start:569 stop:796 length:228 start_codon:yes stop_codon:yes gene_type:complete